MKCIIFAAGYATRLYPLTLNTPKPLLPVAQVPMIERIISILDLHKQVKDIYVVTNSKFYPNFMEWSKRFASRFNIAIIDDGTSTNEDRRGAIGDLKYVIDTHKLNDDLLLIAGDNLFDDPLGDLLGIFSVHRKPVIGVYDVGSEELAKRFGVVEVNRGNIITSFEEKPAKPASTLIGTMVYALPASTIAKVHQYVSEGHGTDLAGAFIKYLSTSEEVFAVPFDGHWFDIGNLDQYEAANKHYARKQ